MKEFYTKALAAYQGCAKVLQTKMPLDNELLKHIGGLHPNTRGNELCQRYLLQLPHHVTNVLNDEEQIAYEREVRKYQISDLPDLKLDERIDSWYSKNVFFYIPGF